MQQRDELLITWGFKDDRNQYMWTRMSGRFTEQWQTTVTDPCLEDGRYVCQYK